MQYDYDQLCTKLNSMASWVLAVTMAQHLLYIYVYRIGYRFGGYSQFPLIPPCSVYHLCHSEPCVGSSVYTASIIIPWYTDYL